MKANSKQTQVRGFVLKAGICALAMTASALASAQTAGSWLVKVGYNQITPKVTSGDLSAPALPGSKIDIGSNSQPIFTFAYMFTDNISAELGLGVPYTHEITGAGSIQGVGKLGTIQQLPPTLFAQYRFLDAKSTFRPYVGVGLTYGYFRKPTGSAALTALTNPGGTPTTFNVDNAWGVTPQVGVTFNFNDRWFADAVVSKSYISTTSHMSTGQHVDTKLDPVATAFSIGYRF